MAQQLLCDFTGCTTDERVISPDDDRLDVVLSNGRRPEPWSRQADVMNFHYGCWIQQGAVTPLRGVSLTIRRVAPEAVPAPEPTG